MPTSEPRHLTFRPVVNARRQREGSLGHRSLLGPLPRGREIAWNTQTCFASKMASRGCPGTRLFPFLVGLLLPMVAAAAPLQQFVLEDCLNHAWTNEVVGLDFQIGTFAGDWTLTDTNGVPVPCQFSDVQRGWWRAKGRVWTVVSLPPGGRIELQLRKGRPAAKTDLALLETEDSLLLSNEFLVVRLPQLPGALATAAELPDLPPPIRSVNGYGSGQWVTDDNSLPVREATTTVLERGPVRATVRQRYLFSDGRTYQADFSLGARQDAVLVVEDSDVDAIGAGLRFSLKPALEADHVYWHNQWKKTENADSWALTDTAAQFGSTNRICRLRPWSFWWLGDITPWAGFYRAGREPFVGFLAMRPSRWSPAGWEGFDRTEIAVTARPGGQIDLTFPLVAATNALLHREWAVTVGTVSENVPTNAAPTRLRQQLAKYSEFPLDEVRKYGFGFRRVQPDREHPYLIITPADVARIRRQAAEDPAIGAQVAESIQYILTGCHSARTLTNEGWQAYYRKNYWGNYHVEKLPEAYLGSTDPILGQLLAAAVKGLHEDLLDTFLEAPSNPALGAFGPWVSEQPMRLLLNYDLIAGSGLLSADEESAIRNALLFAAHVLNHPDYWNTEHGLCSANPNMTSSIRLPLGLLALYLDGHPRSGEWLSGAETELREELADWVSPGGAWIENPGYQAASLDGMFLLAQAIRNVQGRDYFADPQFQATMDYYGFLLTPPDRRFPPGATNQVAAPMVLPSIGDMFAGYITCFNGWMARATAAGQPAYSARQQFYWQKQNSYLRGAGRAKGFTPGLTDPSLPAAPPKELSRAFPGFGSVMRTSWTDPRASYVAHRTGPNSHHYHDEHNSIVYYAKGAPLCTDFGNCYQPLHRREAWYHNRVSFCKGDTPEIASRGELVETRWLPDTLDYSHGRTMAGNNSETHRHVVLVKSADLLGANYVVIRDTTAGGPPDQKFYWNLWCLAKEPVIQGPVVHFPGQHDVDLDVHVLSPASPRIEKDHWDWKQQIYVWGPFAEEQHGMRILKDGPNEDFLTVLYPRTAGQAAAEVKPLAEGGGLAVKHAEGSDVLLVSPGQNAAAQAEGLRISGQIAFARRYANGTHRLAVVKGEDATASAGDWELRSSGSVAIEVTGDEVRGESCGAQVTAAVTVPSEWQGAQLSVNGQPATAHWKGRTLSLALPAGQSTFSLRRN